MEKNTKFPLVHLHAIDFHKRHPKIVSGPAQQRRIRDTPLLIHDDLLSSSTGADHKGSIAQPCSFASTFSYLNSERPEFLTCLFWSIFGSAFWPVCLLSCLAHHFKPDPSPSNSPPPKGGPGRRAVGRRVRQSPLPRGPYPAPRGAGDYGKYNTQTTCLILFHLSGFLCRFSLNSVVFPFLRPWQLQVYFLGGGG